MPFSKENRRFTLTLIAVVVVCLGGLVAFTMLSSADPERTAIYGTVLAAFCPVLSLQIINLAKTGQVETKVDTGQVKAEKRTAETRADIVEVKRVAQAGSAEAVAAEIQKTISQQLLDDEDFLEGLAGKLAPRLKREMSDMLEQAGLRALQLYAESEARKRVQT